MNRRKIAWFVLGCAGMALVLAVLYVVLAAAQTTHAIRDTQVNNRTLLATIQDCTQPTGDCYRRGQQQTASAVSSINRVVILAAACASGLPGGLTVEARQNAIQACVIDRLSTRAAKR